MGALDAFYSTWQSARDTFGQGTPQDGSRFDGSPQLTKFQESVGAAKPDYRWQGPASDAYAAKNRDHAAKFGVLAGCDQRLSAEVTNAANVVTAGRQNLDQLKSWVDTMARSVPEGGSAADRDSKLTAIANQGLSRLQNIIMGSHNDMSVIAGRMNGLTGEYQTVGGPGKPKEGPDIQSYTDNEKRDDDKDGKKSPEMRGFTPEHQAQLDVERALKNGDPEASARIDDVLTSIKPGERLSRTQDAYLTQMQKQQHSMSVDELAAAESRLGEHKNIVADSWQLMSNDDVEFSGGQGDPPKGAASVLPEHVERVLKTGGVVVPNEYGMGSSLFESDRLKIISEIVKDGNPAFQTGTELDRQIILASDRALDGVTTHSNVEGADAIQSLFQAVDDDHQIINDHLTGRNGVDPKDFLHDVTTYQWEDDGLAAGHLFSWTGDKELGQDSMIAAETAEIYADYIGREDKMLLQQNGHSIGDINPSLVQGMAHGLAPYIPNIAGLSEGQVPGFHVLDSADDIEKGKFAIAKGVFSVLSSDEEAGKYFNAAAQACAVEAQDRFGEEFKDNPASIVSENKHLNDSATLQALVDAGLYNAYRSEGLNGLELDKRAYGAKSAAFDLLLNGALKLDALERLDVGKDSFSPFVKEAFLGAEPTSSIADNDKAIVPDMAASVANTQMLNGIMHSGIQVAGIPEGWLTQDEDGRTRVKSFSELKAETGGDHKRLYESLQYGEYTQKLAECSKAAMGDSGSEALSDVTKAAVMARYNQVAEILDLDPAPKDATSTR